jgi:hypothetical protein
MEPISNIISFEESSSSSSPISSKPKLTDNIFELNEGGGLLFLSWRLFSINVKRVVFFVFFSAFYFLY